MELQRQSNGQMVRLEPSLLLHSGGEGSVYALAQDNTLVAKVYHNPTDTHASKLSIMVANPPHDPMAAKGHTSIAWPVDLLRMVDHNHRVAGFLMPRLKKMRPSINYYNPSTRKRESPLFNYLYLHRTARNIAAAVRAIHARGYVIGDVSELNTLVANEALATLVDTDSFQVRDAQTGTVYRCLVGRREFTPAELQGKDFADVDRLPENDLFGLALLAFLLLMEGNHPFGGVYKGAGEPPPVEECIGKGYFPYAGRPSVPYDPPRGAPPFEILAPRLRDLFVRCFIDGHGNPQARPDAQTWVTELDAAEQNFVTCSSNDQHRYSKHLAACPWCERTAWLGGRDPFPSLQAVQSGQHLQPILAGAAPPKKGKRARPPRPAPTPAQPQPAAPPVPQPVPPPPPHPRSAWRKTLIATASVAAVAAGVVMVWPWAFPPPPPPPTPTGSSPPSAPATPSQNTPGPVVSPVSSPDLGAAAATPTRSPAATQVAASVPTPASTPTPRPTSTRTPTPTPTPAPTPTSTATPRPTPTPPPTSTPTRTPTPTPSPTATPRPTPTPLPPPTIVTGSALAYGNMARGEIYPPGDVDLYTFAGKDGDVAFAQLTRGTLSGYTYMEILDPAGKSIASDSTSNLTLILRPTLSITGLHRILVRTSGSSTGTYAVALTNLAAGPGAQIAYGDMLVGALDPPGDVDLYTFAGKAGEVAFAQITRGTLANGVYMEILDPAGKSIASDSTSNQTLILRPTLSITGLHRILVSAWGGTGTYAVALQKVGG